MANKLMMIQSSYAMVDSVQFVEQDRDGNVVPCGDGAISVMDDKLSVSIGVAFY